MATNPNEPPEPKPATPAAGLWPDSRKRRERAVQATTRAWLLFALRAMIFLAVLALVLYLSRVNR